MKSSRRHWPQGLYNPWASDTIVRTLVKNPPTPRRVGIKSQPTETSRPSPLSRLSIHVQLSNPCKTKGCLLFWGHPVNQPANNWTCFGHYPNMFWASSRHVLATSRHVLGSNRTCFWASSRHFFGHHPDMFWASSRHILGIIWTCFGHHLDNFFLNN